MLKPITALLLLSIAIVLAVPVSSTALSILDHFEIDRIDQRIWEVQDPAGILSVSGSLLQASGPPNATYGNFWSKAEFRGDFEFVLDWRDFQASATLFQGNHPGISLVVVSAINQNQNYVFISRGHDTHHGEFYLSNGILNGQGPPSGTSAPVGASQGLLKIARTGSTITTQYNENGVWHALGTFPNYFTDGVTVSILVYSGDNGTFHVASDSISSQAQEVVAPPFPDIQANGSHVPVVVPPGQPLKVGVTLNPGAYAGAPADWWVAATTPFGLYWYTLDAGWVRSDGPIRVYGGGLFSLPEYPVLSLAGLPAGAYRFYFGVDPMNGFLEMNDMQLDWVDVTIQ